VLFGSPQQEKPLEEYPSVTILAAVDSVRPLLENKIVLIKPAGAATGAVSFETAPLARIIALGDPASVPAGQYARG
jgi:molybdate transport system substrate-binding protein